MKSFTFIIPLSLLSMLYTVTASPLPGHGLQEKGQSHSTCQWSPMELSNRVVPHEEPLWPQDITAGDKGDYFEEEEDRPVSGGADDVNRAMKELLPTMMEFFKSSKEICKVYITRGLPLLDPQTQENLYSDDPDL